MNCPCLGTPSLSMPDCRDLGNLARHVEIDKLNLILGRMFVNIAGLIMKQTDGKRKSRDPFNTCSVSLKRAPMERTKQIDNWKHLISSRKFDVKIFQCYLRNQLTLHFFSKFSHFLIFLKSWKMVRYITFSFPEPKACSSHFQKIN